MNREAQSSSKVFGVGLSRTGTTSLAHALNCLGIDTMHYPHDARTHEELAVGNLRLSILNHCRGIVDITAAPFYAQLDRAWPGSRFILTVRNEDDWMKSVEAHWRWMTAWWDRDPQFKRFTRFICTHVYGSPEFDEDRFRRVCVEHHDSVCAYFSTRPGRLLVMDICAGDGWEKLCPFLGLAVPLTAFPRSNRSGDARAWTHTLERLAQRIAGVVPQGAVYILVDQGQLAGAVPAGRRSLPFPEQGGVYQGPPADGDSAVQELQRLRRAGASFIVFAAPALWWLDHYAALRRHLAGRFSCLHRDEEVVIFGLRSPAGCTN